jgi:hypothetical protein
MNTAMNTAMSTATARALRMHDHTARTTVAPHDKRRVRVAVCCNDFGGQFEGRVYSMRWQPQHPSGLGVSWTLELAHDDFERGAKFTLLDSRNEFKLHRSTYPFVTSSPGVGSARWQAFLMHRNVALRLLCAVLRTSQWWVDSCPERVQTLLMKHQRMDGAKRNANRPN